MRYSTVKNWARYFELEEGIKVADVTIGNRLLHADKIAIKARDRLGRIFDYYSESEIREVCEDLLKNQPQADESGFFEKDGVKYGTANAWAKVLPISSCSIRRKLKKSKIVAIKGKIRKGHIRNFYSEQDVHRVCSDLLQVLPQADQDGFIKKDGVRYGTSEAWSRFLQIYGSTIIMRMKNSPKKSIKGRHVDGKILDYYSETDVKNACKDLLNRPVNVADKHNFFDLNGEKYGTMGAWSRLLNLSYATIRARLRELNKSHLLGCAKGQQCKFYSESDIREACSDLLQVLPQSDQDGFIMIDGVRHTTIVGWSRILPISKAAIIRHLNKANIKSIKGVHKIRKVYDFYSEADVRSACSDILDEKKSKESNPKAA